MPCSRCGTTELPCKWEDNQNRRYRKYRINNQNRRDSNVCATPTTHKTHFTHNTLPPPRVYEGDMENIGVKGVKGVEGVVKQLYRLPDAVLMPCSRCGTTELPCKWEDYRFLACFLRFSLKTGFVPIFRLKPKIEGEL